MLAFIQNNRQQRHVHAPCTRDGPFDRLADFATKAPALACAGLLAATFGHAIAQPDPQVVPTKLTWKTRAAPNNNTKVTYTLLSSTASAKTKTPDCNHPAAPVNNVAKEWFVLANGNPAPALNDSLGTLLTECPAPVKAQGAMGFIASYQKTVDNDGDLHHFTMELKPALVHSVNKDDCSFKVQEASASAKGKMEANTPVQVIQPGPHGRKNIVQLEFKPKLGFSAEGHTKLSQDVFKDPVVVEVEQFGVGVIASEDLFWFECGRSGVAAVVWDDPDLGGITMMAVVDGRSRAYIAADYPSLWVTNAIGPFSAILEGGAFTATGAFMGLPWELTTSADGSAFLAHLPAAFVPDLTLEYEIPESLITPGEMYGQSMSYDSELTGSDACCPECPADYNVDGFVDGIDYDQFNNDFEAGNLAADYNGDWFVDGIDADLFNNDFETPCP